MDLESVLKEKHGDVLNIRIQRVVNTISTATVDYHRGNTCRHNDDGEDKRCLSSHVHVNRLNGESTTLVSAPPLLSI